MREYAGTLHVHSTDSDGSRSKGEIVRTARGLGLDFIGFNDHNTLAGKEMEGWHDGILVVVGSELNHRYNHYLAYGIRSDVEPDTDHPQRVIEQVKAQGGAGFLAHPFEKASPLSATKLAYIWNDWTVKDFDGICIWNFMSAWKGKAQSALSGLYYFMRPFRAVKDGPDREALQLWDSLCRGRRVAAIGGTDAHEFYFPMGLSRRKVFPYEFALNTINTHILTPHPFTGDGPRDLEMAVEALREGRCFIALDGIGGSRGFRFFMRGQGGSEVHMGEEVPFRGPLTLSVTSPKKALMRLVKNGNVVAELLGKEWQREVREPGVYRVELFLPAPVGGPRAWVFSNPIYVREEGQPSPFRREGCGL